MGKADNGHTVWIEAQGKRYAVVIGEGVLARTGESLAAWQGKTVAVIADQTVAALHGSTLRRSLDKAGLNVVWLEVPSGEQSKCPAELGRLYDELLAAGITRGDVMVAFGGGVTGDLAGYAAATYLRGVPCVQIPTTLLAQVDSSVGGKVAIDLPQGKNLVGTFSQPVLVLADTAVLSTLPAREFAAGMAEVIKYGCIGDARLFSRLQSEDVRDILPQIIARCCQMKADIVASDPLDHGERMLLNFGHTLGHAIETVAGYGNVLHGEGVAMGMVAAARWGERWGDTPPGTAQQIAALLARYHLPTANPVHQAEALLAAIGADKKSDGEQIRVVLLKEIGQAFCRSMDKTQLAAQIRADWAANEGGAS